MLSAVITSKLPWDEDYVYLETVRANPDAAPVPSVREPIAGLLTRLGIVHLAWEKVNNAPSYGVIEVSSIIKRECTVPAC